MTQIRIDRTRMAMHSTFYAYTGTVALADLGLTSAPHGLITIVKDGIEYLSYVDATRPASIDAMPLGWGRYTAAIAHEHEANIRLLGIAQSRYPELKNLTVWPQALIKIHLPVTTRRFATRFATRNLGWAV